MDGSVLVGVDGRTHNAERPSVLLQTVPIDRPPALRHLYWRNAGVERPDVVAPMLDDAGRLLVPHGTVVSFDTYFGGFFEYHWRLHTRLRTLTLRVDVTGEARLRIWRRLPHDPGMLLHEQVVHGPADIVLPAAPPHFRQAGLVWFDIAALDREARLNAAAWLTADSEAADVRLDIAICTFDRPRPLAAVLEAIAAHAVLRAAIARVIVVNQGRRDLWQVSEIAAAAARLGSRLLAVDQPNFGGAGGFGRGLLEALRAPAVTHVCFLDDDVILEPDCLLRMAAIFSLSRHDITVGGHMLDAVRPTTLYEAGATIRPDWTLSPRSHAIDLRDSDALTGLLDSSAVHYNGWWMFGFPTRVIDRVGLPLPCFIRGDDVEFGMRLHQAGIPTVPFPGVAVWHEPFYLKLGGWQLYYETRNAMLCAALHQAFTPRALVPLMLRRLLTQLLTYRYYGAALIVRAMEDVVAHPDFLSVDPRTLHAGLAGLRDAYPQAWTAREQVLPRAPVGRSPRWRPGFVLAIVGVLARNAIRRSRADAPRQVILVRDFVWFRIRRSDALAVDTYWDAELPTYCRDRAAFRRLLVAGLRAIWRLARTAPAVRAALRDAAGTASTKAAWGRYLGLP